MTRRIFYIVLIVTWLAANVIWGAEWQFRALGNLGGADEGFGKSSQALGVSADGRYVVGESMATVGLGIATGLEGLMWSSEDGSITRTGTLDSKYVFSSAKGVSVEGRVVVGESETEAGKRAFRWDAAGGIQSLGTLPGHDESVAWGVSADGRIIVGASSSFSEELAFRWSGGKLVALGDLPGGEKESKALAISTDGSTIVGYSSSKNGTEACVWTADGVQGLGSLKAERFVSRAFAVSADGKIVVGDSRSPRGPEAFRWTEESGMEPLGDLPGGAFQSKATGVSADGSVIVGTVSGTNGSEACLWNSELEIQPLAPLLQNAGKALGWRLSEVCGVADNGRVVVGWGVNPQGENAGWVARYR
jgi:probable HAF family extracellular repeat protein